MHMIGGRARDVLTVHICSVLRQPGRPFIYVRNRGLRGILRTWGIGAYMGRLAVARRERAEQGGRSLPRALALTFASALVWGVAHLATGRRIAGALLMALFALLVATVVI